MPKFWGKISDIVQVFVEVWQIGATWGSSGTITNSITFLVVGQIGCAVSSSSLLSRGEKTAALTPGGIIGCGSTIAVFNSVCVNTSELRACLGESNSMSLSDIVRVNIPGKG